MKAKFLSLAVIFIGSYLIVSCSALLFALRPWDPSGAEWVSQHDQIYFFYFIGLQIPGVVPFMLLWGEPSLAMLAEHASFGFSIFLGISTWKALKQNDLIKLRKLTKPTLILAISTVAIRLLGPIMKHTTLITADSKPYDVHNVEFLIYWVNFESTLILTLLLVQFFIFPRVKCEQLNTLK